MTAVAVCRRLTEVVYTPTRTGTHMRAPALECARAHTGGCTCSTHRQGEREREREGGRERERQKCVTHMYMYMYMHGFVRPCICVRMLHTCLHEGAPCAAVCSWCMVPRGTDMHATSFSGLHACPYKSLHTCPYTSLHACP